MTTIDQIRGWLEQAEAWRTHMLVVCDTYDHEDYPHYTDNVHESIERFNGASMQRIMEVYDLSMDHDEQLKPGTRVWNVPS